ncbi:MAG: AmmeMemoRadiSam system protein A [Planctomycetota bacterium]
MTAAPSLSGESRAWLSRHALAAVLAAVRGSTPSPVPAEPPTEIQRAGGVFVTVRVEGRLRGCLGTLRGEEGLVEAVGRLAAAAAVRDPRFPPVRAEELPRLELEISVLGPPERCEGAADLTPGRHGIAVSLPEAGRQGVLLPSVAPERGWDGPELVRQAALKGGIEPDHPGLRLERFEVQSF